MNNISDPGKSSIGPSVVEAVDYLHGVESSTCLLLTPSSTALDFKHPLSQEMTEGPFITLNNDDNKSVNTGNSETCIGDSSSSGDSNSIVQDPVSAQLINNISMLDYHTLSKNGDAIMGQPEGKVNGSISLNNRKLPNFVNWNWVVIRKVLLWFVVSGLMACLAAIVAMVITIPKTCNPHLPWYQGKVFYEVFPASFRDSNNDGIGDLQGIITNLDYIKDLGATAIRLNYIFEANDYPEHYYNTTLLLQIDRSIGVLSDFQELITAVHQQDMFLVLDLPVINILDTSTTNPLDFVSNYSIVSNMDPTTAALVYWAQTEKVDGFYLKNLEKFVDDISFGRSIQIWKEIIGNGKILMASEDVLYRTESESRSVLLNKIDLFDVYLDINEDITRLKNRIDKLISGVLWDKPFYPWVHWNIGNVNTERISMKHKNNTLALFALELALPGTVGIFYGDEVGLGGIAKQEIEGDFHEHKYVHNLVPMPFFNKENTAILPWSGKSSLEPNNQYLKVIRSLIELKFKTPTLYLRGIIKEGNILKNIEIQTTEDNLVVMQRWYPRRNTCVFVSNLGNTEITTDLSSMFYGGTVVAATNSSLLGQFLYFDKITFQRNSAILFKLEK
ncbi:uncharacterized protein LOC126965410 [Leptidea sinapis]|uniref:uncharacterized protein LOC126965410 n=1 Tax=Leptidea sinapis TaxID=189913 RepID=UPI0021445BFE|nr:uncharacterized protein LOC126965410 [Leptidea sinapis]